MTEQNKAALRKACEILRWDYTTYLDGEMPSADYGVVFCLARHLDAEDKAARAFYEGKTLTSVAYAFARRHILPDPKPTVQDILLAQIARGEGTMTEIVELATAALRDARLLREADDDGN